MPAEKLALPLADNIRFLRKEFKLSQAALGEKVGLSRSNIASYENAKAEPRAAKLAELARFFNVSLERLITGDFLDYRSTAASPHIGRSPIGNAHDLREHLAGFDERNNRLKQILGELSNQLHSSGNPQAQADLAAITRRFEHMLAVMQELLRNDEELVGVLAVVSGSPKQVPAG